MLDFTKEFKEVKIIPAVFWYIFTLFIVVVIASIKGILTGDMDLLKISAVDAIHEPYRKQLIHEFDDVQNIVSKYGVFLISGSGSTCLLISKDPVSQVDKDAINGLKCNWQIFERTIAKNGSEVLWKKIF